MAYVLITGGAGFIGANLTRRLLEQGHRVAVLDTFCTGRRENLCGVEAEVVVQDVREALQGSYDWVFHLACPASPPHYQADPLFTLTTAFDGTRRVLELARHCGARVLVASTSEVYGDPQVHPQPESYWGHVNPVGPRSCYDEGKRAAETLALLYRQQFGVDVRLVRIFNTYGPYMDPMDGRVISNFITQALQGKPLSIYGEGGQTRSCQYIDDLLQAFLLYMEKDPKELEAFFSARGRTLPVLNLGNPQEVSIRHIAETVLSLIPESSSSLSFKPLPVDDPKRRKPDISWAQACLGWSPRVSLTDGLARTITYFRNRL